MITILFVTQSIEEAIRVGNRILLLSAYPGTVKADNCCRRAFMKSCFMTYETTPSKVMP